MPIKISNFMSPKQVQLCNSLHVIIMRAAIQFMFNNYCQIK